MKDKINIGFIGCGGHSWRNIFPTFQWSPINLVATCDLDEDNAKTFAKQFGADRYYTDYHKMLGEEELDAVFVVAGYDQDKKILYPKIAIDAMRAGCHAWIEKPPANSVAEVREMIQVEQETGKFVMVGCKKVFFPSVEKAWQISRYPEFGKPTSIYVRYPIWLPSEEDRKAGKNTLDLFDHTPHPGSVLRYFMGPIDHIFIEDERISGAGMITVGFKNGSIGVLHSCSGMSGTSPLERLEIIGQKSNVVIDNGIKVTWYRKGERGLYGKEPSFLAMPDDQATLYWEPEFSLGVLYNKGIFLEGFVGEVTHFAECILKGEKPHKCGSDYILEVTKLYEALCGPSRKIIEIPED